VGWSRKGRSQSIIDRVDQDAVKTLARQPTGPTMAERTYAEPCVFLSAKDDARVREMRSTWKEDYAR